MGTRLCLVKRTSPPTKTIIPPGDTRKLEHIDRDFLKRIPMLEVDKPPIIVPKHQPHQPKSNTSSQTIAWNKPIVLNTEYLREHFEELSGLDASPESPPSS